MLETQVLDCPVCGGRSTLTVTYHRHGVADADGDGLVTVASHRCDPLDCSIPVEDLLALRVA